MDDPLLTSCRLCMNAGVLKNIFYIDGDTNFSEKIMSCLDIKLEPDDGLPDKICEFCEINIHNFYNFKHKCTEVDTKLRSLNYSLKVLKMEDPYDHTETEYFLKSECNVYNDALSDWLSDNDTPNLGNLFVSELNENPKNLIYPNLNELKLKLKRKRSKKTKLVLELAGHDDLKLNGKIKKKSNSYLEEREHKSNDNLSLTSHNSDELSTKKPATKKRNNLVYTKKTEPNLQCEFCGQTFKNKPLLNQHLVRHTGDKPYSCDICSKTFTRKDHKIVHMRSHSGLRPFVCNICGKGSTKRQDLLRHMRIHSEEKKYSCSRCDRRFKRSGDVHSHMRSHTGDRPYSCDLCVKSYSSHSGLTKHYRNNCRKIATGK